MRRIRIVAAALVAALGTGEGWCQQEDPRDLRAALAAFAAAATADAYTTAHLPRGNHEEDPLLPRHPRSSQLLVAGAIWVGGMALGAAALHRRGHRRLALAMLVTAAVVHGALAAHNARLMPTEGP